MNKIRMLLFGINITSVYESIASNLPLYLTILLSWDNPPRSGCAYSRKSAQIWVHKACYETIGSIRLTLKLNAWKICRKLSADYLNTFHRRFKCPHSEAVHGMRPSCWPGGFWFLCPVSEHWLRSVSPRREETIITPNVQLSTDRHLKV